MLVILLEQTASAQIEPIRLTYHADEGCPTEDQFVDGVRTHTYRTRRAAGDEEARTFAVDVRVDGSKSAGVLRITGLGGEVTTRRVTGDSCEEVVSALTLITALAIDPQALLEPGAPAPAPAAPAAQPPGAVVAQLQAAPAQDRVAHPAVPETRPVEAPLPRPPPPVERLLRWSMGFDGQALGGFLPDWGAGGGPFVEAARTGRGVFVPSFRASVLTAALGASFPGGVGAHVTWFLARLEVCPVRIPLDPLLVAFCAGADGGMLRSEGSGLPYPGTETRPWLTPLAFGRVAWALPEGLWFEASAGIGVPLQRYRFYYQRGDAVVDVSDPPSLGAAVAFGAGYRLP
jgi:hypothetical protein